MLLEEKELVMITGSYGFAEKCILLGLNSIADADKEVNS